MLAASRTLELLDEINELLRRHTVRHWPDVLSEMAAELKWYADRGNADKVIACLRDIEIVYGGMGSFNDLFINDVAGDDILPP